MAEQFANQATSTLSTSISAGATSLAVKSASKFPAEGNFRIVVGGEIMLVTGVASKTFTVVRGQEGTTAATHASGDSVSHVLTAGALATYVGAEKSARESADSALASAVTIINLGTDWSDGERLFGFGPQNSAGRKFELLQGKAAAPDEGNQPPMVVSRVLKTPEALFSGDGAGNLAAGRFHTTAVAGSEGQSIGLVGSAITLSKYEAGHSLADGIGGYFLGVSKGESTRTGMGLFANGRTETNTGRATGIEVVVDNESETEDSWTGAFPRTKGIHLHAVGAKRSAVGLFLSNTGVGVHTGIAAMTGALISSAFVRDDSEAPWSMLIGGKHAEAALAIKAGAGALVVGAEKPTNAATYLEVNAGAETKDPAVVFKVTSGSIRTMIAQGPAGQVGAFAAAGNNAFVTGTVSGDSGLSFAPGKTFHIGANGKTSMLRLTEAGLGFFGTAGQAKPTGVAKTAEGIWTALNTLGLIA